VLTTSPQLVKHKTELLDLFKLLFSKTYSKRGFSWSGKLLNTTLYTLTHTYPKESRFVDEDLWTSQGKSFSVGSFLSQLHKPSDQNSMHRTIGTGASSTNSVNVK
jgi:proteasome activator subunit 4